MSTDTERQGDGVVSGLQDWKVEEKGTTIILTRLHGAERVRLWFSTDKEEEEEDEEDGEDEEDEEDEEAEEDEEDEEGEEEDQDKDDDDDDNNSEDDSGEPEDIIKCKISFYKPRMGVLLVTALVKDYSFIVHSIAHSPDSIHSDEEWECRGHYFGKAEDLHESVHQKFDSYIMARGIDNLLASFITRFFEEKQDAELMLWFRNVDTFISN